MKEFRSNISHPRALKLAIFAIVALLLVVFIVWVQSPREPRYEGQRISVLLRDFVAQKNNRIDVALREIGTNAIPYVVRELEKNDSRWRPKYRQMYDRSPPPIQKLLPELAGSFAVVHGANAFSWMGTNSLSSAITLLNHKSPSVRQSAAWGISSLRRQSPVANQAIPALTTALSDPDRMVRFYALLAFKEMGADAWSAVPAITSVLTSNSPSLATNTDFHLSAAAAVALGKIGPSATNALPALEATLLEPNSYLRGQAATAIWRISGQTDDALPALLREIPAENEHSKWDWIVALGEMGPRAKAALPQLRLELDTAKEAWVLQHITNALKQIDPQAFENAPSAATQIP